MYGKEELKGYMSNTDKNKMHTSNSILLHSFNSTAVRDQDKDSMCQTFVIYSTYQTWCK